MMKTKICNTCSQSLPLECFTKHPGSADGLQPKCRICRKQYDAQRYVTVRDEQISRSRAWNLANPDRVRISMRKADSKRKAERNASRKKYDERIKQATPSWADLQEIEMYYELAHVLSQGGVRFHVDHIIPIRGKEASGFHVQDNLRVISAHENRRKGNRLIELSSI